MNNWFEIITRQINTYWDKLSNRAKKVFVVVCVAFFIVIAVSAIFLSQPRYVVLFSGLNAQEASQIYTRLGELDVIPRIEGVSTILVPEAREAELRMQLTAEGFPKSGVNFNIFPAAEGGLGQFGQTDRDKRMMQMLQLQERLAASIRFLDSVEDAVVTIAIPETSQFVLRQDQIPVTASVIIQPTFGNAITSVQASNIERLVAKSVPGLNPENITIIDRNANILNRRQEENLPGDQFELQNQMQERLNAQVLSLLEPVFGLGNVVSTVNVTLNFDREVTESVRFEPVVDDSGIIISREALRERMTGTQAAAVVGVTPNITQYPTGTEGEGSEYDRRQETVNYEVNEIKERIERQQGRVEDLSISVIISSAEMSPEMLTDVTDLVAKAVGTDVERVSVHAMQFDTTLQDALQAGFDARQAQLPLNINTWILVGGIAIALLVVGMVLKKQKKESIREETLVDAQTAGSSLNIEEVDLEKNTEDQIKKQLDKLASQRPDAMAQLLRNWLTEE